MSDKILEFWNARAGLGDSAGTNDLPLKQIEMSALAELVPHGSRVLDIGCGNGITAFRLAERKGVTVVGIDYAAEMVENAKREAQRRAVESRAQFVVGDIRKLGQIEAIANQTFDIVISERVLINLASWVEQRAAIRDIVGRLAPGGRYLMCESVEDGLVNINRARACINLPPIEKPWHNRYLRETEIADVDFATLRQRRDFSATYYFLSRVVNAWVAKNENAEPRYDSVINQLAPQLAGIDNFESTGFGQTRLWVWERKAP
jgi:ubiquinone/menaquinone biosynthesis C-methylase UbiE